MSEAEAALLLVGRRQGVSIGGGEHPSLQLWSIAVKIKFGLFYFCFICKNLFQGFERSLYCTYISPIDRYSSITLPLPRNLPPTTPVIDLGCNRRHSVIDLSCNRRNEEISRFLTKSIWANVLRCNGNPRAITRANIKRAALTSPIISREINQNRGRAKLVEIKN